MPKSEYVSLHNHSYASILDGFSSIDEYTTQAANLKMKGLGLTDHGYASKIYEFIKSCHKKDLTPTPGIEMYLAPLNPEGAKVKNQVFYGKNGIKNKSFDVSGNGSYLHMTIFAINNEGLHNLFRLSTMSWLPENYYMKPRIDFDMLAEYNEGLIVSTGCPSSEISTRFLLGQSKEAYEYANRLKEVFGSERLFVEVMNHNMKQDLERKLIPKQLKLAKDLGLKLLATNDCHYTYKDDHIHHEEMLCTQSGSTMKEKPTDEGGKRFSFDGSEYYLKTAEEMEKLFPEDTFPNALTNSLLINEMSQDIKLKYNPNLKPIPIIPENYSSEEEYFQQLINKGYKEKYGNSPIEIKKEAKKRIAEEYEVLASSDFIGYMITVIDYLNFAKKFSTIDENGKIIASSIGIGRGSVGGSIIAYLTGISELDPIKHDLLFERFLSSGRGNIYKIKYDDGTEETIVASEKKEIIENGKKTTKYIHKLKNGDEIIL